jgi:uncharacterized protein YacL
MMSLPAPDPANIAHTIQLAVAPVFMLAGIGSFLNVLAGRLVRTVDRARQLEQIFSNLAGDERARAVWELRVIDRRMKVANASVVCCTLSGALIGLLVAALFVAQVAEAGFGRVLSAGFVAAMLLFVAGLVLFLFEVRLAIQMTEIRVEHLEATGRRWLLGRR